MISYSNMGQTQKKQKTDFKQIPIIPKACSDFPRRSVQPGHGDATPGSDNAKATATGSVVDACRRRSRIQPLECKD